MFKEVEKYISMILNFVLILMVVMIILACFAVFGLIGKPQTPEMVKQLQMGLTMLAIYSLLIYPAYQLRKIMINIAEKKIFTDDNILRFKRISYPFFILAAISCIGSSSMLGVEVLAVGFFAFKMETFLILILALLALLMSYIFQEAKDYKEENELTI